MSLSRFAGQFRALDFAYGGLFETAPPALTVVSAPGASGAQTVTVQQGFIALSDGTVVYPLNINAPIVIGSAANAETVTPSAVSNNVQSNLYGATSTATATFANAHYAGDRIGSGTVGLQEAINFANAYGGGEVIIDAKWYANGGTATILTAAVVPSTVAIIDVTGGSSTMTKTVLVPNASVLTLSTVGVPLIAAPGAGNLIVVDRLVVEQVALTAAFSSGGVITAAWGTQASQTAATGSIAATVLTGGSGTTNQIGMALGVAPANGNSSVIVNKAVGLYAATGDFTTGGGSLIVKIQYRILTGF
jgi:hypothetical protein